MYSTKSSLGLRIVLSALITGVLILCISYCNAYSDDMKQELSEKVTEYLPDMESSLAQL
ncbi:MAG: hypothetical protein AAF717_05970 [Bacteroidota bacterium]